MSRIVHKHQVKEDAATEIKVGTGSILRAAAVTPEGLFVWVEHEVDDAGEADEKGRKPVKATDGILLVMAALTGNAYDDSWVYHSMVSIPAMTEKGPKLATWHILQSLVTVQVPDGLPADFK